MFNTSEVKPYFINACCFGDDVAKWLIAELRAKSVDTEAEPGQEDFGWYLNFQIGRVRSTFVIGYRPGDDDTDEGTWIGWLERNRGLVASLLGGRGHDIDSAAAKMLNSVLSGSKEIRDVRWHDRRDFDKGNEDLGTRVP